MQFTSEKIVITSEAHKLRLAPGMEIPTTTAFGASISEIAHSNKVRESKEIYV